MRKHLLLLVVFSVTLIGCESGINSTTVISQNSSNTTTSVITSNSVVTPNSSSSNHISSSAPINSSITPIPSSSTTIPTPSASTSIDLNNLRTISIKEAIELGKNLENGQVGQLVKIEGTYLRTMTWTRSSDDIMIIIDGTGQIGLHVPYAKYTNYLASRYVNENYVVVGNMANNDGRIELVLNDAISVQDSFASSKKTELFDPNDVTTKIDSIENLVKEFDQLPLNRKKYGVGKIVTVDAQLVAVEYEESNKKALFSDGQYCITVVSSSGIATKTDIGKYYSVTGIMSVEVTSPALWYLSKTVIEKDSTTIVVDKATTTRADAFKKYSILGDNYNNPSYLEYMTLYKTKGYITDDEGRTSKYYLGIVDEENGSLNDVGGKAISGLLLLNHQGLDDKGMSYSPFLSYYTDGTEIELYYSLNQYSSNDHGWKAFAIEALVK